MGKTLSEKVWDEHVVRSAAGEPARLGSRGTEHPHGLVEDSDAARLSHVAILTSRILGYQEEPPWE